MKPVEKGNLDSGGKEKVSDAVESNILISD
jgi:hypothetical protein